MSNFGRAFGVTAAMIVFIVALDALGPPTWLRLVALAAAVAVTWRYWWVVNRRRMQLAWLRRREEWRHRKKP